MALDGISGCLPRTMEGEDWILWTAEIVVPQEEFARLQFKGRHRLGKAKYCLRDHVRRNLADTRHDVLQCFLQYPELLELWVGM